MHVMTPTAGALLACLALIACGGGDWESVKIETTEAARAAPAPVRLEGCVVDAADRPAARAVQARAPDGRVVATGVSGTDGVFRLQLPADAVLRIETLGGEDDGLALMTGRNATALGGCLRG